MSKKHKAHEPHEEHADESWLIPYADLLTLLLALFIVLFASSNIDARKFEEISMAFNSVFNGGEGVMDKPNAVRTGPRSITERNDGEIKKNGAPADSEEESESTSQQTAEQVKQQEMLEEQIQKENEELSKLKEKLDQYIKESGLTTQLDTKLNHSQLMITISDNALYPSGSATVKPEARKLALTIADMLQQYPEYEVVVAGHTDNEPISNAEFKSNRALSSRRADNFMDILLTNTKLDPSRFSSASYGEYRPIASNDTAAGRAKNRRVEVSIIRKFQDQDNTSSISTTTAP